MEQVTVACESCGTFVNDDDRIGCASCARMVCPECTGMSGEYCDEHEYLAEVKE
jgi:hypothetical protein